MTDNTPKYIAPPASENGSRKKGKSALQRLPLGFIGFVGVPTLLATVYYMLIATPIYVSEAQFIVRNPSSQSQPSGLGLALQGVGLPSGVGDTFAVHEYVMSRDGLRDVQQTVNVRQIIGRSGADMFVKYPAWGEDESEEGLYKGFQRFVTVGYETSTGISTLRVKAFTAEEAHSLAEGLLQGGEALVNRLNERSAKDAVESAELAETEAKDALLDVERRLTSFRNTAGYVDPELMARESSAVTSQIQIALAELRAEREQLQNDAPQSPQLPMLNGRINALERQLQSERSKLAGASQSLASSVGAYQRLLSEQEIGTKRLQQATAVLVGAREEARRQQLYLARIVNPSVADKPILPRRERGILTVFLSALLLYGLGWLVYAGIREHRQS